MSFDTDIKPKIEFSGYANAADEAAILAVVKQAYDGSATAKAMIDTWLATAGHKITFKYENKALSGYTITTGGVTSGTGEMHVDVTAVTGASYITPTGKAVADTLLTAVVHELGHALTGRKDNYNTATPDYKGDNVTFVNTMYTELGLDAQLSYIAYDASGTIHKLDYQYTNGAAIDDAVTVITGVSYSPGGNFNSSNAANTRDLLIGDASANTLETGGGNDFLFGGGGNDTLSGGAGTDTAVYIGSALDYDIRRNDDGTWAVKHLRGAKDAGSDTLQNMEKIQFDGGKVYDLAKHGMTFQTDFALVIDTTGSMGSSINSVKAQANALIDAAFGGGTADARIGVVGFKDTTNGEPSSIILPFTDQDVFADRKAAAIAAINSITVGGGGDTPETDFDGLIKALDGSMGKWRVGAGILRIALFTDAPVKDTALAGTVTALASSIGASITAHAAVNGSGGAVDTFDLSFPAAAGASANGRAEPTDPSSDGSAPYTPANDPIVPDTTTSQVQIFTIYTNSGTPPTPLSDIAAANGGAALSAPTNDDLVAALMAIISAPSAPVITGLTPATDDGASNSDGVTSIAAPVITGTATAGTTITVLSDGATLGTTTADGAGAWSFTPASPLAEGAHNITATAADSGGNTSAPSAAFALTIEAGSSDILVHDTTTDSRVAASGTSYSGPVAGLSSQYINLSPDGLAIAVATDGWFIHSGAGDDAIAAHGGTNVLDGGGGSNFLTGGSGPDTFFVDQRGATGDIWSTIVGFAAGDGATLWGINPHDFRLDWRNDEGAAGYTGLTLHASAGGMPTTSLTLAGYSALDLAARNLRIVFGTDSASGSDYMHIGGAGGPV